MTYLITIYINKEKVFANDNLKNFDLKIKTPRQFLDEGIKIKILRI